MLTAVLAHDGRSLTPGELWSAWNLDPLLIGGLVAVGWVHRRGRKRNQAAAVDGWRSRCFVAGLIAIGVALVSPLEALAGALASAHMVQHVLLVLVAAPLLAISAPLSPIVRGLPWWARRRVRRLARAPGLRPARRHPGVVWAAHVGVLWFWHASLPYEAALRLDTVHMVEHATFLITGALFWNLAAGPRSLRANGTAAGSGVLLLFTMALQSVFLSVLLTFARTPWYSEYSTTTGTWGLDPLADQQLAGAIMWVPAGAVYVGAALLLLASWLRRTERDSTSEAERHPVPRSVETGAPPLAREVAYQIRANRNHKAAMPTRSHSTSAPTPHPDST